MHTGRAHQRSCWSGQMPPGTYLEIGAWRHLAQGRKQSNSSFSYPFWACQSNEPWRTYPETIIYPGALAHASGKSLDLSLPSCTSRSLLSDGTMWCYHGLWRFAHVGTRWRSTAGYHHGRSADRISSPRCRWDSSSSSQAAHHR